ncbi:PREDICTED: angiogenin-4-like [Gekko japonicus]|uniref:Angiogenin-4-like n=1 Tax=Gekko japonicus TaxID=146911 RepID=A0ABM1KH23_GEKJA|nr:PREDICTED: angiogenin-4-like [Gekko japonicus]
MTLILQGSKALLPILLLCFLAVTAVSSQSPFYTQFLWQHIDFPRSNIAQDYCGVMMRQRGMTRPCKNTNSFVHISKKDIKDMCTWAATYYRRNLRLSKKEVPVTTCFLERTAPNRCFYWSYTGKRYIYISCDKKGWPVHFEETNFM